MSGIRQLRFFPQNIVQTGFTLSCSASEVSLYAEQAPTFYQFSVQFNLLISILFSNHLSALLQFSIYLSHLLLTARDSELLCSLDAVDFNDEFAELKLVFSAVEGM